MTFMGMGSLEVLVILIVAFIVIGPQRMIDAARLMGKATTELRRMSQGLTDALEDTAEEPRAHRPGGHTPPEQGREEDAADAPSGFEPPRPDDAERKSS